MLHFTDGWLSHLGFDEINLFQCRNTKQNDLLNISGITWQLFRQIDRRQAIISANDG